MPRFEPHPARRPAIVAGASSGIGAATAIELAAHGFPVALGARRVDKCQSSSTRSAPTAARRWPATRRHRSRVGQMIRGQATEQLGDIEVLVSGAGDTYFGRMHEIDTDDFRIADADPSDRAPTGWPPRCCRAWSTRQRGDLIFVGSDVALRQRPHMGAYGAAKAGLVAMVTNLQMELEGTGVRASIVHPGPTRPAWAGAARRTGRPGAARIGRSGVRRATTTSCGPPTSPGRSRSSPRRRAGRLHREHGSPARGAVDRRTKERQELALGEEGMPNQ